MAMETKQIPHLQMTCQWKKKHVHIFWRIIHLSEKKTTEIGPFVDDLLA